MILYLKKSRYKSFAPLKMISFIIWSTIIIRFIFFNYYSWSHILYL